MADLPTDLDDMKEARLKELLAQLYKEPTPEAHFEERFLQNFQQRVVQQAVCQPIRKRLWEHLLLMVQSVNSKKLALASTAVITFGAFSLMMADWAVNSDSGSATANRDRVKRGMQASFDSLMISSSLKQSPDPSSGLNIHVVSEQEENDPYTSTQFYTKRNSAAKRKATLMGEGLVQGFESHQLGY